MCTMVLLLAVDGAKKHKEKHVSDDDLKLELGGLGVNGGSGRIDAWLVAQTTTECRIALTDRPSTFELDGKTFASAAAFDKRRGTKRAALCAVRRSEKTATSTLAMVSFSSDMSYVVSTPNTKNFALWPALVERGAYADRWRLPHYLLVGTIEDRAPDKNACPDAAKALLHVVKTLALLRVFLLKECGASGKPCAAALYADMDTAPGLDADPSRYLRLDPHADFVVSSNIHKPILANSGVFLVTNTPGGRALLRNWWGYRCARHDQLALWKVLFDRWATVVPRLRDLPIFASYTLAHNRAMPELVAAREATWPALRGAKWACAPNSTCGRLLHAENCVSEPISVGATLLVPMHPFAPGLPPLQGPGRKQALFCHKIDCFEESTSDAGHPCGGSVWNGTFV